jgi:hypothetical protein
VPYYWIVDVEARTIEAHGLGKGRYALLGRTAGAAAVSLPPFPDLTLVPTSLWP